MYRRDNEGRWFVWSIVDADDNERVSTLWQEACNQTQWRPEDNPNQMDLDIFEDDEIKSA